MADLTPEWTAADATGLAGLAGLEVVDLDGERKDDYREVLAPGGEAGGG